MGAMRAGLWSRLAPIIGLVFLAACRDATAPHVAVVKQPGDTVVTTRLAEQAFIYTPGEGMSPIPALPGAQSSEALAINDAGEVVGINKFGSVWHAFYWSKATGTMDIGRLPGAKVVSVGAGARGINASGQIVGWSDAPDGNVHAFRWSRSTGMTDIGAPDRSHSSWGYGINSAGDIVGEIDGYPADYAFRWTEKTGLTDAGELPTSGWTLASAINDAGVVAGSATTDDHLYDDPDGALVWTPSGARNDLAICASSTCYAEAKAINQTGVVVGHFNYTAFRWSASGGLEYLIGTPALLTSRANGINDAGQVVGEGSVGHGTFALLWISSEPARSLGTLPGYVGSSAQAINNAGQIVGYAF